MKTRFSLLKSLLMCAVAVFAVALTGCKDDDNTGSGLTSLVIVTEDNQEVKELTIPVSKAGLSYTFGVKTESKWTATSKESWISLDPASGKGASSVTLTIGANTGAERTATVAVAAGSVKRTITVVQKGASAAGDPIYYEAFGSVAATKTYGSTGTYWPYVDQYNDAGLMTKEGTGAEAVTYTGSNVSVRPSKASAGYEGVSGVNSCLFSNGTKEAYLIAGNIALGTAKQLTLTFGISHSSGSNSYTVTTADDIVVAVSGNGTDFVTVNPTYSSESAWGLAKVEFGVPADVTTLYIKYTVAINAEDQGAMRIDDITLAEGGTGAVLDLTAGGGGSGEVDYPKTAVSTFAEGFDTAENYAVYKSDNWYFTSTDALYPTTEETLGWHGRVYSTDKYIACAPYKTTAAEIVAYAGMVPFDVAAAKNKTLTFVNAIYYQTADNTKLEVVASKDFAGKVGDATWTVVKDCSIASSADQNVWNKQSVDLSSYASENKLYVAFRYTGKAVTYRIDSVSFNGGEIEGPVVSDPATLPFTYNGANGKAGIENVTGFDQYGLGEDYAASNSPFLLKFGTDQACVILHYDAPAGQVSVKARSTGVAVKNGFSIYGSVDGKAYTRIDSVAMDKGKNVEQTITTAAGAIDASYRFLKIAYNKLSESATNAAVSEIQVTKAGGEIVAVPTVVTAAASAVTSTSATLNGSYTYTGKGTVSEAGFYLGTTKYAATLAASFTKDVTGLTKSTAYSYKAYVVVDGKEYFGADKAFTTEGDAPAATISVKELVALWFKNDADAVKASTVQGYIAKICKSSNEGMSYGTVILVDNTADTTSGTVLYNSTFGASTLEVGDLIKVNMANATIGAYSGVRQFTGMDATKDVSVVSSKNVLNPAVITAKQLNESTSRYQSMYVQIANAKPSAAAVGQAFGATSDKTWIFNDGTEDFKLYVKKNYTDLLNVVIANKAATLKGIATAYVTSTVSNIQIAPASAADLSVFADSAPRIDVKAASLSAGAAASSESIEYTLANCPEGAKVSAKSDAAWAVVGEITATSVAVAVAENTATSAREANITLSYDGAASEVVKIVQAGVASGNNVSIKLDFAAAATYPVGFPTATGTKTGSYTMGGYTFAFKCNTAFYYNATSGYLMIGKAGKTDETASVITLPAIEGYKLSSVTVKATSGGSENVSVAVTSGTTAVSGGDAWQYVKDGSKTFTLASTAANTAYSLYILGTGTSTYNSQFAGLELVYSK